MSSGRLGVEGEALSRPPKRKAAEKARSLNAEDERNHMKATAEAANKKRKAAANKRKGDKRSFSKRNTRALFPGVGHHLHVDSTLGPGAEKAGNEKATGARVTGMSAASKCEALFGDEHVLGVLDFVLNFQGNIGLYRQRVAALHDKNANVQKMYEMLLDAVTYVVAKGGTEIEGGVILGSRKDYEDNNSEDNVPSDWGQCLAKWRGGAEMFQLLPKDALVKLISAIYEDKSAHFLLDDENLPVQKDIFWSIGYHYISCEQTEAVCLLDILHVVCPNLDWKSIPQLKRKRGNYV